MTAPRAVSKGDESQSGTASVRPTVVQCPGCSTKFAVNPDSIAGIPSPKFHCSRCDNIFSIEDSPKVAASSSSISSTSLTTAPPPTAPSKSASNRSLEIPKKIDTSVTPSAPHEASYSQIQFSFPDEEPISSKYLSPTPHTPTPIANVEPELKKEPRIFKPAEPEPLIEKPLEHPFSKNISTGSSGVNIERYRPKQDEFLFSSGLSAEELLSSHPVFNAPKPELTFGNKLLILLVPIGFIFAILGFLAVYLITNPTSSQTLMSNFLPESPQLAPPELVISKARFKIMSLDNGETIGVISGRIDNSSTKTFKDIILEGAIFDEDGEKLSTLKVRAGADLYGTRIKSLSTDMIKDITKNTTSKYFELAPNSKEQFTFAFLEQPREPKFFTVRIYSVS